MTTQAIAKSPSSALSKPSALNVMASKLSVDPTKLFDTLKATVFKNASNEELLALVVVANTYDLNPFLKEIYAFPAKGGGIVPIVSVDGWNKMLLRQPGFDGIEFDFTDDDQGNLVSCTATIFVKERSKPVKITEFFAECKRNTDPWNNMPRRMLRNRTLCQASRVAFGFSGIHDEDEAQGGIVAVDAIVTSTAAPTKQVDDRPMPETKAEAYKQGHEDGKQAGRSIQDEVETLTIEAEFTFDHAKKWGLESGNIPYADSITSFSEIKTDECKRILRSKAGYLKGLAQAKGEA